MSGPAPGPLNGVRVIDFTHVWAGPLATRVLGDLGADIIKVEAPWARGPATPGPANPDPRGEDHWNRQGVTNKLNRNKSGICLDSKSPAGHKILTDLVRKADVVIENFSAKAMTSMGLDWASLEALNPRIIYVAMPGFGHSGPYRDYVAYGTIVEPMCGLTALMGYGPDEPRVSTTALPDPSAGLAAAAAVVTALARRDADGKGRYVELSLQEAAIALFGEYFLLAQLENPPGPIGNAHADYAPNGVYRCAGNDNWLAISVCSRAEWHNLTQLVGEALSGEAFATFENRQANRDALDRTIEAWTCNQDKLLLMAELQHAGVPAGAVQIPPEMIADPHNVARQFYVPLGADHIDTRVYAGLPITIDGKRYEGWRPAPRLGEHNREVLGTVLGMSDAEITQLELDGVITTRPPGQAN